jgi:hypothetical protein
MDWCVDVVDAGPLGMGIAVGIGNFVVRGLI